MNHILCICLSSTIQRTITFSKISKAQVNRSEHYIENASGKAVNSARVLNQLEKNCAFSICPLGENNAQHFLSLAEKDNLDILSVLIPGNTRLCCTLLDKNDNSTTELVITEPKITDTKSIESAEIKLLKLIDENIDKVDAVLLAGSRPAIWSDDLYSTIAGITKDRKKIFLADYIGNDLTKTISCVTPDIIKINDEEFIKTFFIKEDFPQEQIFSILTNSNLTDKEKLIKEDILKDKITELSKKLKNMIVVTRGTDSTFGADKGKFYECPIIKVNPINTTACGDSFNAGFLYEYLSSKNFFQALKKGTWCASQNAKSEIPGNIL